MCVKYSRPSLLGFESTCDKIHLIPSHQPQNLEFNIARREAIKVVGKLYERIFSLYSVRSFQPMQNHNFPMIVDGNFVNEIFEFHPRIPSPLLCLWPPDPSPFFHFSRPVPSYITANFRPTLETFEQLLVLERPSCFIIRTLVPSAHP